MALVAVAAGLGAVLRLLVDTAVRRRLGDRFPWGTLTVNLTGSAAAGLVVGAADRFSGRLVEVVAVGLLGGYTTLSAWAWEALALAGSDRRRALGYAAATYVGCLLAAAAGLVAVS